MNVWWVDGFQTFPTCYTIYEFQQWRQIYPLSYVFSLTLLTQPIQPHLEPTNLELSSFSKISLVSLLNTFSPDCNIVLQNKLISQKKEESNPLVLFLVQTLNKDGLTFPKLVLFLHIAHANQSFPVKKITL